MRALLWKEYRNNRSAIWGGLLMIAGIYAIAALYRATLIWWDPNAPDYPWGHVLNIAALTSLGAGVLIHVWLAAESVAKERMDRSAEFLAYLPISRGRMIAAKGALSLSHAAAMWGVNLAVLAAVFACGAGLNEEWPPGTGIIAATAALGVGAAWLASCVLSNPTMCLGIGQMVPLGWGCFCASLPLWAHTSVEPARLYIWGCAVAAPILFTAGVREYIRRR